MATKTSIQSLKKVSDIDDSFLQNIKAFSFMLFNASVMLLLANCSIGGEVYPFFTGYAAAASKKHLPATIVGGFVGWLIFPMGDYSIKYIASLFIIAIIEAILEMLPIEYAQKKIVPIIALIALGIPSIMLTTALNPTLYAFTLMVSELAVTAGSAYFFLRATSITIKKDGYCTKWDIVSLIIAFCIPLPVLCSVNIMNVSVGSVLITVIILCCVFSLGGGASSSLAAVIGFFCAISASPLSYLIAVLPISSVVAAIFKPLGKLILSFSFIITYLLIYTLLEGELEVVEIYQIIIGSIIFIAIPAKPIERVFSPTLLNTAEESSVIKEVLKSKLVNFSQAIKYVKEAGEHVSFNLDKINVEDESSIYTHVGESVCRRCKNNHICWQSHYNDTIDALSKGVNRLKENLEIVDDNLPMYFRERCPKQKEIINSLTNGYSEHIRNLKTNRSVARMRDTAWQQLDIVAKMMEELSENVMGVSYTNLHHVKQIKQYFSSIGATCTNAICYADLNSRYVVEITLPKIKLPRIDPSVTAAELSGICEHDFDFPQIKEYGEEVKLIYHEVGNYKVLFGLAQHSAYNQAECGDYCKQFTDNRGNAYTILSDGMGNGKEAAVQSVMTVDMLSKLIEAGSDYSAAVQMVNASLMAKSNSECTATIDVATVNLYTAGAEFYKAGAAPSFVSKNSRVGMVRSSSLPIGIIKDTYPERFTTTLYADDIILMISDGITATGDGWLASELKSVINLSPQEIAEHICSEAKNRRNDLRQDDMTAAVMKIIVV